MNRSTPWRQRLARWCTLWIVLVASAMPAVAQQATGNIGVSVLEQGSGRAVFQAQVSVVNTTLGGLTGPEGRVLLRGVPVGRQQVRVLRVGYAEQKKEVTVSATTTVAVEFTLSNVAIQLTPVVTTATGETRRVELGHAVVSIDASKLTETAPIASMNDLLNGRTPGVLVTPGMQTGAGARIRIRGTSSLALGNDPIYIIDCIRMNSGQGTTLFTGDNNPSRVGDINPNEIENIEIVKGPSAATLYGTDAANGVVVITTKKGRAGAAQWTVNGESGMLSDRNVYPYNYTIAGHSPGATAYRECALPIIAAATCLKDSVRIYSPLKDPKATPLGNGYRGEVGIGVRGGTDAVRYNVQASREKETGIFKLPDFEYTMIDTMKIPLRPWLERPNVRDATSVRANISMALNSKLDVNVSTGFVTIGQRLVQSSNATAGLGSQGFGGPGYEKNGNVATVGTPLHGYRAWTPVYTYQEKVEQGINRFIGSTNINWRPTSWLQTRADIGNDFTDRVEDNLLMRGEGPPISATYRNGFVETNRADIRSFTANLSATASWNPRSWLNGKTTFGAQYVDSKTYANSAQGTDLPPGTQVAGAAATPGASQSTTLTRTLGQFVEQVVAINDRLFLTGAARSDQNSAFGTNFQNVLYPKFSASWVVSEEPWMKMPSFMDQLRLRYAFGKSGVQPGPNDALRTFSATSPNIRGVDVPAVVFNALGNSDLQPEQATEIESGFEARFWRGRLNVDVTWYYKRNENALINAIVPPSLGAAASVRRNLGAIRNNGWELTLQGQAFDRSYLGVDMTLTASANENRVLSLGGTPPQIGTTNRVVEGWPMFGMWARRITGWDDKNKDGILVYNADPTLNELFVADSVTFVDYSSPRKFVALTTGIDLLQRKLRITSMVDWRGGNHWYNNTERIRCVSRQNCNGLMNPAATFEEQAMVVATRNHPAQTLDGFYQPGAFVKIREVSVQYTLPQRLASSLRARSATVTASARNVAKWSKYRGVDPESDFTATGGGDNPADFQSYGAPSYFILRLSFGF